MDYFDQDPTENGFVQDPYPLYSKMRRAGPLVRWSEYDMVCAARFDAIDAILRDRRFGREPLDQPEVPDHLRDFAAIEACSMLELEPPTHTRLRGLVLRAFTSRRVAALRPEIEAICDDLIAGLPRGESFDLLPAFAEKLPVIVIARLLGVPEDIAPRLLAWSHAMVAMYQARRDRAVEDAANTAAREFATYLRGYIDERRAAPSDDLMSHLIAAEEDGAKLSTDELIGTCVLLLNAGHEATVHTIGNGVAGILRHGGHGSDPVALSEEVLRFDPPLHMFQRIAYEDIEVFGHTFRRGERVALLLASANRDEALWPDADRFDPSREVRPHVSLGAGLHFCVGAPLARLELQVALPRLFSAFPGLKIAKPPRFGNTYHFHGLEQLMVRG